MISRASGSSPYLLIGLAAVLAACAGDPADAGVSGTGNGDGGAIVDIPAIPELPDVPIQLDTPQETAPPPETVEEGGFGWPCVSPDECDSGWCVPTAEGNQCSVPCISTCPLEAWGCKPVPTLGGDEVFICLPLFPHLCDPCSQDDDCTTGLGEIGDKCLARQDGGGSFCGGACSDLVVCPAGYDCIELLIGGQTSRQCQPQSGECECSQQAIAVGATTACSKVNESGTCAGERKCLTEGLSDCSATTPGPEICDGLDNDCSGGTDEEGAAGCNPYFVDLDTDDFGTGDDEKCLCEGEGNYTAVQTGDCDDKDSTKSPGLPETCGNNEDDNCNDLVDEEGGDGCLTWYKDVDDDDAGAAEDFKCLCSPTGDYTASIPGDCDDANALAAPGTPEACGNGFDDDCDGLTDEADAIGCTIYFLDNDKDGYGVDGEGQCLCGPEGSFTASLQGDCKDNDKLVSPGAGELCGDGIDNNCDMAIDEVGAGGCVLYYEDSDKDGFGIESSSKCLCAAEAPFLATEFGDCKDTNDEIKPGKTESCNGIDDDCNDVVDDEGAQGCIETWFDGDSDGFGAPGTSKCLCNPEGKWTASKGGDCNDEDLLVFPDAICTPQSCSGHLFTTAVSCGGGALCDVGGNTSPCPGGYVCDSPTDCKTGCTGDLDCIDGNFCVAGQCSGKKGTGAKCLESTECQSGYCAGGFCCTDDGSGLACCGGDNNDCDDDNGCTDNACNGDFQCETSNNTALCAVAFCDGTTYTDEKTCQDGACTVGGGVETCSTPNLCQVANCTLAGCQITDAPAGVLCAAQSCDGEVLSGAQLCDGNGECALGIVTPCPGGFVCEDTLKCKGGCVADGDCQNNFFCSAGSCIPKKPVGAPCTGSPECVTGYCAGVLGEGPGFCCSSGACCGGKATDCDDGNVCTSDSCSPTFQCTHADNTVQCAPGFCDGLAWTNPKHCASGACTVGGGSVACGGTSPCLVYGCGVDGCLTSALPVGTQCAPGSCAGAVFTSPKTCDGLGACDLGAAVSPCPGGFVCADEAGCQAGCETDVECTAGLYCKAGICQGKKKDGESCDEALPNSCQSGYCSNGFCCASGKCCAKASDCDDGNLCTNDGCSLKKKCTKTFNTIECIAGSCDGKIYTPPSKCKIGVCEPTGTPIECAGTEPCFVFGCEPSGCKFGPALSGTVCADPACNSFTLKATTTCNGAGSCSVGGGSAPCPGGFVCNDDGSGCTGVCADDDGCQPTHFCADGGTCQPKRPNGSQCTKLLQCESGYCNNGYCCSGGTCCGGKNNDCDDGNVCSTDVCGDSFKCSYDSNTETCIADSCAGLVYTHPKTCNGFLCSDGGGIQDCAGSQPCKVYGCGAGGCVVGDASGGTKCLEQSCSGYTLTGAKACNGSGACNQGGVNLPCPGGYTCLDATDCRTTCETDVHCAPDNFCANGSCQPTRPNGDACSDSNQCASGYCANGYCCEGPGGDCCSQSFHCDDSNECTSDTCSVNFKCKFTPNTVLCQAASCDALTHTTATYCGGGTCSDGGVSSDCSGAQLCKVFACDATDGCVEGNVTAGVQCAAESCSGSNLTQAKTCSGAGQCSAGGQTAPCAGGFVCKADGKGCESSCSAEEGCQSGWFCQSGVCQNKRSHGDTCTVGKQCLSEYCANGFCCNNDGSSPKCCGGQASHCDDGNTCSTNTCDGSFHCALSFPINKVCEAPKCTGNSFTSSKLCQSGACTGGGTTTVCSTSATCKDSLCNPSLGCYLQNHSSGTPCESSSCTGFTLTGSKSCDGLGTCVTGSGTGPCPGGFICESGAACKTSCTSDLDCQSGLYCAGTSCLAKKNNGSQCAENKECVSAYCAGGFCCASGDCCQTSAHCDDSNVCTTDTCVDFQCAHADNTAVCAGGTCDGLTFTQPKICANGTCPLSDVTESCLGPNQCKSYSCSGVGCGSANSAPDTQCQAAGCVGSTLTQAKTCNGGGVCNQGGQVAPCAGNLKCADASSCKTGCTINADCIAQHFCSSGACLPQKTNGSTCGGPSQCLSGHCEGNICCAGGECCTTGAHCDDGNVCTTNTCENNQCQSVNNGDLCQAASCSGLQHTASKSCSGGDCTSGGATTDCSGANPCISYGCSGAGCSNDPVANGTECVQESCVDGVLTQAKTCNASGDCSTGGAVGACPGNYACLTDKECRGSCSADAHCQSGFYCQAGNCLGKKTPGDSCTSSNQCQSSWCSNGHCCSTGGVCCGQNSDCNDSNTCTDDVCQDSTCTFVNNTASCSNGSCAGLLFTAGMTCESGGCTGGGGSEDCSGTNSCKTYSCTESGCAQGNQPSGVQCAASICAVSTLTTAKQCNGSGACANGGVTGPCPGNFVCKHSTQCHNTCGDDSQCVSGYYCAGGACILKKSDGQPCVSASQCQSAYCDNSLCCSGGTCCNGPAPCNDGNGCTNDACVNFTCTNTNNTNLCEAGACAGLTYTAPKFCAGGTCTGGGQQSDCSGSNSCLEYTCGNIDGCGTTVKPNGTQCQAATCAGTLFTPASTCNGSGSCVDQAAQQCDDGALCNGAETCSTSLGCQAGNPSAVWVCGDLSCHATCETATNCPGDCTCSPAYTMTAGEYDAWNTGASGGTNKLTTYSGCTTKLYPGNEYTYAFVAPVNGQVEVELHGADANTDVLVLTDSGGACNPSTCFAQATGGGGSVTFSATGGVTYYFVVDRRVAGAVDFQLYAHYTAGTCQVAFVEDWQRTPFPRAWSSEANWQVGLGSPFGATHGMFTGTPVLSSFSRSLTSPVFDTSACAMTQLSFDWRYLRTGAHAGVFFRAEVSNNGGDTWTEVFSYDTGGGDSAEKTETITTNLLAGTASARIRFRITGDTSEFINKFQVEDIQVDSP